MCYMLQHYQSEVLNQHYKGYFKCKLNLFNVSAVPGLIFIQVANSGPTKPKLVMF